MSSDLPGRVDGQPFVRLQALLKKERLFVSAQKSAIRDLYLSINALTEKLMHTAWTTQRLNWNLDLLLNQKLSVEQWERKSRKLNSANFINAHAHAVIGPHCSDHERLLRFLKSDPETLATLVCTAQRTDTDLLIHILFFALHGNFFGPEDEIRVLDMFSNTLQMQFALADRSVDGMRTFFRTNTVISKMFTIYARNFTHGKQFLNVTMYEPIMTVLADDALNLEIEPLKVLLTINHDRRRRIEGECRNPISGVLDEAALLRHPAMRDSLESIYDKLISLCVLFIDSFSSKLAAMPFGIRYMCRLVREGAFAVTQDGTASLSILGDFLLLRFLNPAVIYPEPYGIITNTPVSVSARRNLTLIAKVLHSLARGLGNTGAQMSEREAYMKPLMARLAQRAVSITPFLDRVVQVADPRTSLRYPVASVVHGGRRDTVMLTVKELNVLHRSAAAASRAAALSEEKKSLLTALLKRLPTPPPPGGDVDEIMKRGGSAGGITSGSKDVLVLSIDESPDTRLLTEKEVLSVATSPSKEQTDKSGRSKKPIEMERGIAEPSATTTTTSTTTTTTSTSATTESGMDGAATPPKVEEEEEEDSPEVVEGLRDAKQKLRLVLCAMGFSSEWHSQSLIEVLEAELFEAQSMSNREQAAHVHEMLRCLNRLPAKLLDNNCARLRQALEHDYRSRSRYIEYLVSLQQNLLVTHELLKRQLSRTTQENAICLNYIKVFKIGEFLKSREEAIAEFVRRFSELELLDEKSSFARRFLTTMFETMKADPMFALASEDDMDDAHPVMEKHFMCRIYINAFLPNGDLDVHKDILFHEHVETVKAFTTLDHESLQIQPIHQSEAPWPAAQKELLRVNAYKAPGDKLACIVLCCKTIMDLLQMTGKSASADDFFPVLVYVILSANPPSMLSTIQFIKYFFEDRASGEASYWWAQFTIAIEFIKTIQETPQRAPNK